MDSKDGKGAAPARERRLRLYVVCASEHEETLREWLGASADTSVWVVGVANPDIDKMLRASARAAADAVVIDDAMLEFKEISEPDMLKFPEYSRGRMVRNLVFIASPGRTKDDPFVRSLVATGVATAFMTRYFADDPEAARAEFASLLAAEPDAEEQRARLDSFPDEPRRRFRRGGRDGVADVLAPDGDGQDAGGAEMTEADYFRRMASGPMRPVSAAPAAPSPPARPAPPRPAAAKPRHPAVMPAPAGRRVRKLHVAVAGIEPNIGCTHLALAYSFYLADLVEARGERVMCLLSDKAEYDAMTSVMETSFDGHPAYKGVCFDFMGQKPLPDAFEYVVCDCGLLPIPDGSNARAIFATAKSKLVVAGGGPWDFPKLRYAVELARDSSWRGWIWCLFGATFAYEGMLKKLYEAHGLKPKIFYVPYDDAYFEPGWRPSEEMKSLVKPRRKKKKGGGKPRRGADPEEGRKEEDDRAKG